MVRRADLIQLCQIAASCPSRDRTQPRSARCHQEFGEAPRQVRSSTQPFVAELAQIMKGNLAPPWFKRPLP